MDTDNFLNKYNPLLCKVFLAASDFIFFNISLALSIGCVYWIFNDLYRFIPDNQLEMRIISHVVLSVICVGCSGFGCGTILIANHFGSN